MKQLLLLSFFLSLIQCKTQATYRIWDPKTADAFKNFPQCADIADDLRDAFENYNGDDPDIIAIADALANKNLVPDPVIIEVVKEVRDNPPKEEEPEETSGEEESEYEEEEEEEEEGEEISNYKTL